MTKTVYPIHQAINRPVSFRGLKGQYIMIAASCLVGDLLLFIILYCCKLPPWFCIGVAFGAGAVLLVTCVRMSQRYGQYGLLKKRAFRKVPPYLRCRTRKIFTNLNKSI